MPDVVLPVLDEAEALPWVLGRMPDGFEPIVVDNGSTDGSGEIARGLGARVVQEPRRGFGAACSAGLLASRSDLVCFMDCDGSLHPRHLAEVVRPVARGRADMAIGERIAEPGAWPLHARLSNRILAAEVRRRTGVVLRDLGPMRATSRADLLRLDIRDRRFGWPLEMVLRAAGAGWRIEGVPVPYLARSGQSKVTGTLVGTIRAIADMGRLLR